MPVSERKGVPRPNFEVERKEMKRKIKPSQKRWIRKEEKYEYSKTLERREQVRAKCAWQMEKHQRFKERMAHRKDLLKEIQKNPYM